MAPTMSPVDFNRDFPDSLEHPESAMDYFMDRGETNIWAEHKYMGSRGYILAFRDPSQANQLGYTSPVLINSRGGFSFFREVDDKIKIWNNIESFMTLKGLDFVMLDCEILPWSLKAKRLIDLDFYVPGECAQLSRKYAGYGDLEATDKYMDTLELYSQETPLEVRAFNILGCGNITQKRNGKMHFCDVQCGLFKDRSWHYELLKYLNFEYVKSVHAYPIDLFSRQQRTHICMKWEEFCKQGGEGFVFKPNNAVEYLNNGYMLQPALKVRGKDYLRLIYGIDYLEENYFRKVAFRKTKMKRLLAIQEHEVGINILRSFLNGNHAQHRRFVAGFIGMENVNMQNIDATL